MAQDKAGPLRHPLLLPSPSPSQVALQHDHHSAYILSALGGDWAQWLMDALVRPACGLIMVALGWMFDAGQVGAVAV